MTSSKRKILSTVLLVIAVSVLGWQIYVFIYQHQVKRMTRELAIPPIGNSVSQNMTKTASFDKTEDLRPTKTNKSKAVLGEISDKNAEAKESLNPQQVLYLPLASEYQIAQLKRLIAQDYEAIAPSNRNTAQAIKLDKTEKVVDAPIIRDINRHVVSSVQPQSKRVLSTNQKQVPTTVKRSQLQNKNTQKITLVEKKLVTQSLQEKNKKINHAVQEISAPKKARKIMLTEQENNLLRKNPMRYTIQLAEMDDYTRLLQLLKDTKMQTDTIYRNRHADGTLHFVVLLNDFKTVDATLDGTAALPKNIQHFSPVVKLVSTSQLELSHIG